MKAQSTPYLLAQLTRSRKRCLSLDLFKSKVKQRLHCLEKNPPLWMQHKFTQEKESLPVWCPDAGFNKKRILCVPMFFSRQREQAQTYMIKKRREIRGHTQCKMVVRMTPWENKACMSKYSVCKYFCGFFMHYVL